MIKLNKQQSPGPSPSPIRVPFLQRKCACSQHSVGGSECSQCDKQREITLRRSPLSLQESSSDESAAVLPVVEEVLHSTGQPLDSGTRAFMEPRFGRDFSQVRVHTDARATESARKMNALAYTVGRNVVFGAGQHSPHTSEGKRLMAHELIHVTQQSSNSIQGKLKMGQTGDSFEQEADRAADQIDSGPFPLLDYHPSRLTAPSEMILPYRNKKAFNFGKGDEPGILEEDQFTDAKTQPWIEQITLKFDGTKTDVAGDLVATGTLEATYNANMAALPAIKIGIVGGSTSLGLTDMGTGFKVHRIEGIGYNDVIPPDPEGKSWPANKYSKSLSSSMHYAVFFKGKQAIHGGALDTGSHSCIHVDWTDLHTIRQINYHSVKGKTTVDVSYDATALKTLCCSRMKIMGWTKKGHARNPCRGEDPKACP